MWVFIWQFVDGVCDGMEDALNLIEITTERSGNMRELKPTIFQTVSTLRYLFIKMKKRGDSKSIAIRKLEMQVCEMKAELIGCNGKNPNVYGMLSGDISGEPVGTSARGTLLTGSRERKLYSEALKRQKYLKGFKLTVKSKGNKSSETINGVVNTKTNPAGIEVGINSLKSIRNGKVLIETDSKGRNRGTTKGQQHKMRKGSGR
jgi:hypothetical protein